VLVVGLALACGSASVAGPITFTGSSGSLAASAGFETSGTNLVVTLTNTSAADVLVPTDVLTAIFFDIAGVGALTPVSAVLGSGSSVFYDPDGQPAGGVVGGEWAYKAGLVGAPGGATEGISSSGFSLFGPADLFPGPDLQSPTSPDGLQYGILSAGDNSATGNAGVTGSGGLILNSVVFTLSGLPGGFDPSADGAITNVSFQYGTALTEPNVPGDGGGGGGTIPEPGALSLLGVALIGMGLVRQWRKNS